MKNVAVRKLITLASMLVIAFVIVFVLVSGKEIPSSVNALLTSLVGYIGYYFGKSTALEK